MLPLFILPFLLIAQKSGQQYAPEGLFQLANPILTTGQVFFTGKTKASLELGVDGMEMRYTLNGSEPTQASQLYVEPVLVTESCTFKARAFHECCQPSEVVAARFFKLPTDKKVKKIALKNPPHESYPGSGADGLVDWKKGSLDFHQPAWMGFSGEDVVAILEFEHAIEISKVTASVLLNLGAWIFPPAGMEVYDSQDGQSFELLGKKETDSPGQDAKAGFEYFQLSFAPQQCKFLKVILKKQPSLPAWHPGNGSPAWLFVDEIWPE
ncbi:MAG: chitobiase/beta-hexosaminidase C-terminal domain-containing protein [Saprospiraceae bacterium]